MLQRETYVVAVIRRERGIKAAGAIVDLVTFGNGAILTNAAKKGVKEFVIAVAKTMAVDALASGATYLTGEMLEELGMPPGTAKIMTAIVSGTVTYAAGKYFFKDELGNVIAEYTGEELDKVLKGEMDDILPEISAVKGNAVDKLIEGGSRFAQGLTGRDFENYLNDTLGGDGSFSVSGREFDGGVGNRWLEAKSGNYWDMLEDNPSMLAKFKSDMGNRLRIATDNGAMYELFSNTPIPESIKQWLIEKGIPFTELLD